MSSTKNELLPSQFDGLASHLSFALPTAKDRWRHRSSSTMSELQAFYDAMVPHMAAIMAYLQDFPADEQKLEPPVLNLVRLAKAFMDVSVSIELLHSPDVPLVSSAEGMILETFS